jgi:O-antigen/teichoic acid export membrane protein
MLLLKRSTLYVAARILPSVLGFAGVAIYTRYLDPASVGLYALYYTTALLATGLGYGWLRVAGFRLISGVSVIEPDMAYTLCVLFAATTIVVIPCEGIALHLLQPNIAASTFFLTAGATLANAWFEFCTTMLQARLNVTSYGIYNVARSAVMLLVSLGLIFAGLKTDALLGGLVAGNLTAIAATGIWRPGLRGSLDRKLVSSLFHIGWPNSVIVGLAQLCSTFQRYAISVTTGAAALGIYSVATSFSQTAGMMVACASAAGQPLAFKARDSGDAAALRKQLSENAQLIFGVALPCCIGLAALSGPIARHLLGAKFQDGAPLLIAIIAISATVEGVRSAYFDQAFEIALKMRPLSVISFIYSVVFVVANLSLIPRYGAAGAAAAMLLAHTVETVVCAFWGRKVLVLPIPLRSLLKTTAATAGMVLVLRLVPLPDTIPGLIAGVALGAAAYIVISALTRLQQVRTLFVLRPRWLSTQQ